MVGELNMGRSTSSFKLTAHAICRLSQRGLTARDVEIVRCHGMQIRDGFLMTRKAIEKRQAELKHEIQRLERLDGVAVIEEQAHVITAYRAAETAAKRMRRVLTRQLRRREGGRV